MSEQIYLNEQELNELLKIGGFLDMNSGSHPVFYEKFLKLTLKNVSAINAEEFKDIIKKEELFNDKLYSNHHRASMKLIECFKDKFPIPETFTWN